MLMRGTQKHNRQQLQDELDKLKAQMSTGGGAITGANLSISTVRAGFPGALKLAAEVLREPAFPETEFEQMRQADVGRIESQRSEPRGLTLNALNRHLNPYPAGDPREVQTYEESIDGLKKLTLADVKKFYADFYGASNAELAVVGDFDVAEVEKLAAELFGDWKSPAPYAIVKRSWKKIGPVNETIETPDKANAMFAGGMTMELNEDDPDYPALAFANTMIGGGTRSRLWLRIREKDGLSYAVQSAFQAGASDKFAQLLGVAICNPQNISKVESAFKEELAKIVGDGFTADEVDTAKKAFLQEQQVSRAQDGNLVRRLGRNAQHGWTMARDADLERKISALTPEEINAAVKRHVDPAAFSYFKGGDFKKSSSAQ
jgi:zinc protease